MYSTKTRYYHLTSECELENIMKNGLVPSIGENSKSAGELDNYVYFSDEESLPYWSILLNKSLVVVVEVDSMFINMYTHTYYGYSGYYTEFVTESIVPAECILDSYTLDCYFPVYMRNLCLNYTQAISSTVLRIIRSLSYRYQDMHAINDMIHMLLKTIESLDFTYCSNDSLANVLLCMNDTCDYPFTDTYLKTPFRLWEALLLFNDEETFEARKELYDFIKDTYKDVAYTKTGGFTG